MTDLKIAQVYHDFVNEFKSTPEGIKEMEYVSNKNANRKAIFEANLRSIVAHNKDSTKSYKRGINSKSDFTSEEFKNYYNLNSPQNKCSATHKNNGPLTAIYGYSDIPAFWDWR